jgi:hypothetical protein
MGITGDIYRNESYFQVFEASLMVYPHLVFTTPDLTIPLSTAHQRSRPEHLASGSLLAQVQQDFPQQRGRGRTV